MADERGDVVPYNQYLARRDDPRFAEPICGPYEEDPRTPSPMWQGQDAKARCVTCTVTGVGAINGTAWTARIAGRRVKAVEVTYGSDHKKLYLDDEPRYLPQGDRCCTDDGHPGYHGWAWTLVTRNRGEGPHRCLGQVLDVELRPAPSWLM